jgi:hypothetical protein
MVTADGCHPARGGGETEFVRAAVSPAASIIEFGSGQPRTPLPDLAYEVVAVDDSLAFPRPRSCASVTWTSAGCSLR